MQIVNCCCSLSSFSITFALLVCAQLATAAAPGEMVIKHVPVYFGDLSIDTEAAAHQLVKRISAAASRACGGNPSGAVPLILHSDAKRRYEACKGEAVRAAVSQINHPVLTAVYRSNATTPRESMARR